MLKKKYYYPTDKYFFITVLPNSSSFGSTVPNGTDKYLKDSSLSISATPNTGYIFSRWSDNDTNASRTVTVVEDKTYTAIFTLPNYTVTYNGNGNTEGSVPTDSHSPYSSGSEVEVLGNTGNLVKTGYTFDGWNTAADGSGTSYNEGNTFIINTNTTLFANWKEYYIYYTTTDGNTTNADTSVFFGTTVTRNEIVDSSTNLCRLVVSKIPFNLGYSDGTWYAGAFRNCSNLLTLILPEGVKIIGRHAFDGCTNLTSIDFSSTITKITGGYVFSGCNNLTLIICRATIPPEVQTGTFGSLSNTIDVYVPANSISDYQSDSEWGYFTNIQAIS